MKTKRAGGKAHNATKTHCPKGHAYSQSNTIIRPTHFGRTERRCRECARQRALQLIRERAQKPLDKTN